MRNFLPVAMLTVIGGCATAPAPAPPVINYPVLQAEILRSAKFPPLLPDEDVDVYPEGHAPAGYVVVGNISMRPLLEGCYVYHPDKVTQLLKDKARQMGADGLLDLKVSQCEVLTTERSGRTALIGDVAFSSGSAESTSSSGYTAVAVIAVRTTSPPSAEPGTKVLDMRGVWEVDIITPEKSYKGSLQVAEQTGIHFIGEWLWPGISNCRINGRLLRDRVLISETRCNEDAMSISYQLRIVDPGHLNGEPLPVYGEQQQITLRRNVAPGEGVFIVPDEASAKAQPGHKAGKRRR